MSIKSTSDSKDQSIVYFIPPEETQERIEDSQHSLFANLPIELMGNIFFRLKPAEVANLMICSRELKKRIIEFMNWEFGGEGLKSNIIKNYGFTPTSDLRNLVIIQKAFDACYFEGEGENLSHETLGFKMQIVEDRNLVKLFLRYTNYQHFKNDPKLEKNKADREETEFLKQNPDLDTCCIINVQDIHKAASAIRDWMKDRGKIEIGCLSLQQLSGQDGDHFHDKHMCIIPTEVKHFQTRWVDCSNNAFMLVPRTLGDMLSNSWSYKRNASPAGIDLENNRLGAIPDEIAHIYGGYQLKIKGNDPNTILPRKPD